MAPLPVTHSLCLVSTNLSLLSLVIFLFHSLRQLPSPTCPQAAVITLSSPMRSCQSPCYFFPSPICHSRLSSLLLSTLVRSGLHLTDCTLFLFFSPPISVVKDLDTEKYVHLVSTLQKLFSIQFLSALVSVKAQDEGSLYCCLTFGKWSYYLLNIKHV